jgi:hypothetical protein
LNDRLNASELLLRKEVGDKKVDAAIAYFRAAAAQDPSLVSKLYAQPDPCRWALRQMEEFQQQSIVSSSKDTAQTAAALTQAYASGREARINYERWFTALPAGDYQNGASFWASNRSLKTPPTCMNAAIPEWQRGCLDGRERLTLIDARRHTDPNFWWGWNSL